MELHKLSSTFQPDDVIDDTRYESLIWTERYATAGDFELVSSDISRCMRMLPLESYVSLKESTVPMVVESHKIVKAKNSVPKIEVRGRSFETVLERRGSVNTLPDGSARQAWTLDLAKSSDAAWVAIRTVIGDPVSHTVGAGGVGSGSVVVGSVDPAITSFDYIPEISLVLPTDYASPNVSEYVVGPAYALGAQVKMTTGTAPNQIVKIYRSRTANNAAIPYEGSPVWEYLGTVTKFEIKAGNLYSTAIELIQANHHGLKAVRPPNGSAKTTVDIEIYNGADITATTVFDAKFDQFDDATYLLSAQGSTNIAYVYGGGTGAPAGGTSVRKNEVGDSPSGLNRRVLVVDEQSDTTLNSPAIRKSRGLVELYKNNAIAIFDGELAKQFADKYNQEVNSGGYSLGDIIQFNGDYGLSRKVRVVEFIRTHDATGESAYPAFEVIEE